MAKMKAKSFKIMAYVIAGVLLALVIALSTAVGIFAPTLNKFVVGYKDGEGSSASRAKGSDLAVQIQEEGTVLVKNDKGGGAPLLPMSYADAPQVNVFGWASTDWVISGSGSGQVKTTEGKSNDVTITLFDALKEAGIDYNTELEDMYERYLNNREKSENGGGIGGAQANAGALKSFNYEFSRLYEPSISKDTNYYTQTLLNNALSYSDTALVVIGRVSGESNDSPKVQYKGKNGSTVDRERTYLEISTEEEELLEYVGENYENVIVLINTTNVMELGFVETIPGIDACLIVATTGSVGARAIPYIIYNDLEKEITDEDGNPQTVTYSVNPSGKLADTYAYDLSTSSTYADTGSGNDSTHFYTNSQKGSGIYPTNVKHTNGSSDVDYAGAAYQDYREGIYMGYKWYETADEMGFWTSSYAKTQWGVNGYDDVVQYPFGYGLSYTDFSWEIVRVEHVSGATLTENDHIVIEVKVTNTGDVAGQDVVELYYSAPYNKGGIEKSSVNLGAFGKTTNILEPGEDETVVLEMDVIDMASYDYSGIKVLGGGYILEEGTYTLTLRTDAHTVANDKVSSNGAGHKSATLTYKIASDTRCMTEAENRFTGEDAIDGVAIDGNSDGSVGDKEIVYLTRDNFVGTFPEEFDPSDKNNNRAMTDAVKKYNLYNAALAEEWRVAHPELNVDTTWGSYTGSSYKDLFFTDERTVEVIDPVTGKTLTPEDPEQQTVVWDRANNAMGANSLNEFAMKLGLNYDDPDWDTVLDRITLDEAKALVLHGYTKTAEIKSIGKEKTLDVDGPNQIFSFTGSHPEATGYSSIVLAQTWNLNLAYSMGLAFGDECASYGVNGWYGPGVNPHRSPFGGRNYEYYSEDSYLSGMMCAEAVKAAKTKGVFSYLKHLCLYEGESGRDGMYTWLTEQSLREIYIKPFELAVRKGGSSAIMTSYGRIGAVWTGGSEALLTYVVRGEWGFEGAFLTDYADHHDFMNGDQMVRAGGDLWMDWYTASGEGSFVQETSSKEFNAALRNSTKHVVYMWLNALATNQDHNDKVAVGLINDSITIPATPELKFRWYIPVLVVVDVLFAAGAAVLIAFAIKRKNDPIAQAATWATEDVSDAETNGETITCPNCGETLPANAKFCGKCGEPLNKE